MYSTIFLLTGLLLVGSLSIVQCQFDATEYLREMFLDKRDYSRNARHEKRRNYASEAKILSFSKRK
jgi:hypothetical protein